MAATATNVDINDNDSLSLTIQLIAGAIYLMEYDIPVPACAFIAWQKMDTGMVRLMKAYNYAYQGGDTSYTEKEVREAMKQINAASGDLSILIYNAK